MSHLTTCIEDDHVHDDAHGHEPDGDRRHRRAHGSSHDDGHVAHGHSHGLVDRSITQSRDGLCTVAISLGVLLLTSLAQIAIFAITGSLALLADVIHNAGDALTAIPLGVAFLLRSRLAEKRAGYFVVAAIFISAMVAAGEAINRLINSQDVHHLGAVAAAGAIGFIGNELAAQVRTRAGRRLNSAALIADGQHARADGLVSLSVIGSAVVVALGLPIADPLIGLGMTVVILRITWHSWSTVRAAEGHDH